jgi:hypothetical protein
MQVTVHNRGPDAATIHLLPQLWFRNTWSWKSNGALPHLFSTAKNSITAKHDEIGTYELFVDYKANLLFCDNETNARRLFGMKGAVGHFKDAFHAFLINGHKEAVNPNNVGTKAAAARGV